MSDQVVASKANDAILFALATLLPAVGVPWSLGWLAGSSVYSLRLDYESQLALLLAITVFYLLLLLAGVRFGKMAGSKLFSGFLLASVTSSPLFFASGFLVPILLEKFGGHTPYISAVVAFVGGILFLKEIFFWKLGLTKDSA